MQKKELKQYLGDSVYVNTDGYSIILTTENGYGASNEIHLEPWMIGKLSDYLEWLKTQGRKDDQ